MASANDIAVKSAEGFELSMIESGDRACAGQVILHGAGTHLRRGGTLLTIIIVHLRGSFFLWPSR